MSNAANSRLVEAIQTSAFLLDADNAGYLGFEDSNALQKARVDFGVTCQRIALHYLTHAPEAATAKATLRNDLLMLRSDITQPGYEADDAILFPHLQEQLDTAIDEEAARSPWQRNAFRALLALPNLVRWFILIGFAVGLAFALKDVLTS